MKQAIIVIIVLMAIQSIMVYVMLVASLIACIVIKIANVQHVNLDIIYSTTHAFLVILVHVSDVKLTIYVNIAMIICCLIKIFVIIVQSKAANNANQTIFAMPALLIIHLKIINALLVIFNTVHYVRPLINVQHVK
jgi:hypothetical protein